MIQNADGDGYTCLNFSAFLTLIWRTSPWSMDDHKAGARQTKAASEREEDPAIPGEVLNNTPSLAIGLNNTLKMSVWMMFKLHKMR